MELEEKYNSIKFKEKNFDQAIQKIKRENFDLENTLMIDLEKYKDQCIENEKYIKDLKQNLNDFEDEVIKLKSKNETLKNQNSELEQSLCDQEYSYKKLEDILRKNLPNYLE